MKKTILLFDMDGVLVEPRRYRASLQSTMDFFGKIMGWNSLYPGEETISWFESRGIISEWDIAPIFMAGVVETVLETYPGLPIPQEFTTFCEMVKRAKIPKPNIEVENIVSQLPSIKKPGFTYCDLVLYMIAAGPARMAFPRLAGTALINDLLMHSRIVQKNLITRVFQEVFLGQNAFEKTFYLPAICLDRNTERIIDRQLISNEWNGALKEYWENGIVNPAIITARPSAIDYPAGEGRIEFSPEADIIVDQLGWNRFTLIGQGQLQFAADQLGCNSVDLIKPSPVHALGAIGAVITGSLFPSIQAGWDLVNNVETTFFEGFPELDVHILEDSPVGIRGTAKAADMLEFEGVSIHLTKWGIAIDENKINELKKVGATVVPTVNDALARINFSL